MSVVVTGYDQVDVRVGVFHRPDGVACASIGWPFGRFTFGAIGCSLIARRPAGLRASARTARRTFAWTDVVEAETTRFGVTFRFEDPERSVEIGTLRHDERLRLLEAARTYCPAGTFDDQASRTDPSELDTDGRWRPRVWLRAMHGRGSLLGKTSTTRRRQPEQT